MIVASPCAVVLATMPPLLASIANAGRNGVLVKSAEAMERLGTTTLVAIDKTGTLTDGVPRVADVRVLPGARLDQTALVGLAGAVERPSEHPRPGRSSRPPAVRRIVCHPWPGSPRRPGGV